MAGGDRQGAGQSTARRRITLCQSFPLSRPLSTVHGYLCARSTKNVGGDSTCSETSARLGDWDLADIWYATSRDGFNWEECGPAVQRGQAGSFDDRSAFTPDILVHNGKYYLYYQVIQGVWKHRSIHQIGMAWAEGPRAVDETG